MQENFVGLKDTEKIPYKMSMQNLGAVSYPIFNLKLKGCELMQAHLTCRRHINYATGTITLVWVINPQMPFMGPRPWISLFCPIYFFIKGFFVTPLGNKIEIWMEDQKYIWIEDQKLSE